MRRAAWLPLVLLLSACTGPAGGADVVAPDAPPSMPAPGGGVCCALNLRTGCSPGFGLPGGWALSAAQCPTSGGGFDGCPFTASTDSHGCAVVTSGGCAPSEYCGRAPVDVTPGPDGVEDADGGDGGESVEASFDGASLDATPADR